MDPLLRDSKTQVLI